MLIAHLSPPHLLAPQGLYQAPSKASWEEGVCVYNRTAFPVDRIATQKYYAHKYGSHAIKTRWHFTFRSCQGTCMNPGWAKGIDGEGSALVERDNQSWSCLLFQRWEHIFILLYHSLSFSRFHATIRTQEKKNDTESEEVKIMIRGADCSLQRLNASGAGFQMHLH